MCSSEYNMNFNPVREYSFANIINTSFFQYHYTMKMSNNLRLLYLLPFLLVLAVAGCKDPETPEEENEEEVITTMRLRMVDSANTSTAQTFSFEDPDGEGGNAPTVLDDIILNANSTYTVTITLANESDPNNVEDITTEIEEEAAEHFFCFTATTADVMVEYSDTDGTLPIGLTSTWRTGAAGTGTMQVMLKHQPDGLKDGTCEPGETDIDVTFNVEVQ